MLVEGARENATPNGGHIVESPKTSFIYWFTNDTQVCFCRSRGAPCFLLLTKNILALHEWNITGAF